MSRTHNHRTKCDRFWKEFWIKQEPKPWWYQTDFKDVPMWAYYGLYPTPSWWTRLTMNRPARAEAKQLCHLATLHMDPDSIIFPLDKKPFNYYW